MIRITLPANADLSIFDDVLRRPELECLDVDCGFTDGSDDLEVFCKKPVDILAIVAEHIRETDIIPAGAVFENLNDDKTVDCIRIKVGNRGVGNRGLIRYKEQGPELNLFEPSSMQPKAWDVRIVARPEDPKFFDIIDDFCNFILKGWEKAK